MGSEVLEIRWHGRGGQGAKTAAQLVAQIALEEGRYSQGFPEYGPERMGAPIRGFTRVSDGPIRHHCAIERPDVVVVLDETMIGMPAVTEGADQKTVFVVNTALSPAEMGEKLRCPDGTPVGMLYCVDATKISIDELGRPMPNTPMIGALVKATACISISALKKDIQKKFLAKFGERVVRGNIRAIERAYEEVQSS
jgi:pyruvate ferredoxin oxidoreductase gamma subunit